MNYKKLVNWYVFILSILAVNLISDRITDYLMGLRFMAHPVKATAIGLCVLVFLLYPAFHYINGWSERTAIRIFRIGKNAGGKFTGVTLAFLLCLFILYLFYMSIWFGNDVLLQFLRNIFNAVLDYLKGK